MAAVAEVRTIRVVIAKVGLDGHDRGAKIIARALRDAGMEVIYTGLHQLPEQIVETVIQEDADAVGISILSGAHMTLVPRVVDGLRERGADDVLVVVGGTIPAEDIDALREQGVAEVFTPGAATSDDRRVPARERPRVVVRPADYPPPWHDAEAIAEPSADEEAIEVGVLVVGAGPAGLAAAIRLGQLAAGDPATAERLGEVPVAVLEKGKAPGSHLLSGAVIDPKPLYSLLAGLREPDDVPTYGKVPGESVLILTPTRALPVPPPPTMRNHGNVIVSLSQLGRWLAEVAEETGIDDPPRDERAAVARRGGQGGRRPHRRQGARARGRAARPVRARVGDPRAGDDPRRGDAGASHGGGDRPLPARRRQSADVGARREGGLEGAEAAPEDDPHDGWPLRSAAKYREFGGSFIYPMGEDMLTIGLVVGLDYRDAALSVHDLLQELKTHPRIRPLLEGGERVRGGRRRSRRAGTSRCRRSCGRRGC